MPLLLDQHTENLSAPVSNKTSGWTQVVSHLHPKYGGLSAAVPALGSALSIASGTPTPIAAFCVPGEEFEPAVDGSLAVHYLPVSRSALRDQRTATATFRNLIQQSSGVHIHGLWQASTSLAGRTSRDLNKPYVISAHGMLERWALQTKRLKKSIYAALFERRNLRAARCLHALTDVETNDYRRFGLRNPVAVIPNGVKVPSEFNGELFLRQYPQLAQKRLVLFLGRIHPKKGVDLLCRAWKVVVAKWPEAHLVLAGPDCEGTQHHLGQLCTSEGISDSITFTGMLDAKLKWSALAAAEAFILPSHSEGLSVSVLEALGAGLPVIITKACNMPEVETRGCGWLIDPQVSQLESSLTSFFKATNSQLYQMSAIGQRWVAEKYSWESVGDQMSALYRWMEGGALPTNVDLRMGESS